MENANGIERRVHERLFSEELFMTVKFDGKVFGPSDPVIKLNISKGGAAFLTDKDAKIGGEVLIDGVYSGIVASNIPEKIVSKKKVGDIHRLNVQFNPEKMNELRLNEIDSLVTAVSL